MIWRDVARFPMPSEGFVIVWPTVDGTPEVWAAKTYHEARKLSPPPLMRHLAEDARRVTHWAQLPPVPTDQEAERG